MSTAGSQNIMLVFEGGPKSFPSFIFLLQDSFDNNVLVVLWCTGLKCDKSESHRRTTLRSYTH